MMGRWVEDPVISWGMDSWDRYPVVSGGLWLPAAMWIDLDR